MTWLQIEVPELLFESAGLWLVELRRRLVRRALSLEEARAALAAERHLEAIRLPHVLSSWGTRAFNHLS